MTLDPATVLSVAALVTGGAVLLGAALHDVAARTVPNQACLLIAVAGLVARAADGTLGTALLIGFGVFVLAAFLWRRGYMGGGDVKLFGAVSLLVPPSGVLPMLTTTVLAGGVLAVLYLIGRAGPEPGRAARPATLVPRVLRVERWRMRRGGPLPYAVAITFGTFYALSLGGVT